MAYVQGFVLAVPTDRKQKYIDHASEAANQFRKLGVSRTLEAWGEDVPEGQRTDFRRAVAAEPSETVVFSIMEHESKAQRDSVFEKMMGDPEMQALGAQMPFDGKRIIFGGFEPVYDSGPAEGATFCDAIFGPATVSRENFRTLSEAFAALARGKGALRVVDCWGDDIPEGKLTDIRRAVAAEPGEDIVMGWIEWPSRATRDAAWGALLASGEFDPDMIGCDPQRVISGGFSIVLDQDVG